ncbi:hypothetical protein TNCV_4163861 [Trichonephila clavipes]|nr:hypothetical protein TNCV_4163861 [Trichonephila clavipes]
MRISHKCLTIWKTTFAVLLLIYGHKCCKKSSKIGRPDWTTSESAMDGSPMPEIIFKILCSCRSIDEGKPLISTVPEKTEEAIRNGETNISCDIITLLEQLHNKRKSCILQRIPAHVNTEGNECADSLAKAARDIDHKCTTITLDDANAVAKHRIMNHT